MVFVDATGFDGEVELVMPSRRFGALPRAY
jgi:hypothetical protein